MVICNSLTNSGEAAIKFSVEFFLTAAREGLIDHSGSEGVLHLSSISVPLMKTGSLLVNKAPPFPRYRERWDSGFTEGRVILDANPALSSQQVHSLSFKSYIKLQSQEQCWPSQRCLPCNCERGEKCAQIL